VSVRDGASLIHLLDLVVEEVCFYLWDEANWDAARSDPSPVDWPPQGPPTGSSGARVFERVRRTIIDNVLAGTWPGVTRDHSHEVKVVARVVGRAIDSAQREASQQFGGDLISGGAKQLEINGRLERLKRAREVHGSWEKAFAAEGVSSATGWRDVRRIKARGG